MQRIHKSRIQNEYASSHRLRTHHNQYSTYTHTIFTTRFIINVLEEKRNEYNIVCRLSNGLVLCACVNTYMAYINIVERHSLYL